MQIRPGAYVLAVYAKNQSTQDEGEKIGEFTYQESMANRAVQAIGREMGMFIDRKEVGKAGEFAGMTGRATGSEPSSHMPWVANTF